MERCCCIGEKRVFRAQQVVLCCSRDASDARPENASGSMTVMALEYKELSVCGSWSNVLQNGRGVNFVRPVNAPDSRVVMALL